MAESQYSLPWPKWRWEGSSWWLTIAGSVLAAIALLWPALVTNSTWVRVLALAGAFIGMPLAVLSIAYAGRGVKVLMLRISSYNIIVERLVTVSHELGQTKQMVTALVQEQNDLPQFEIERVLRYGEDVYIRLAFSLLALELNDRIAVVDRADGMVLGHFDVTEVKREGYQARSVGTLNPVWSGFLRQTTQVDTPPPPGSVALLIAKGKSE